MARFSTRAASLVILVAISLFTLFSGAAAPALAQGDNVVVVNVETANIRSGPAANTTSLGSVTGGTELPVTGRSPDGAWWRVLSPFGTGWISDVVVVFRGSIGAVPFVSEPAGTLEAPYVIVDGYPVTVYRNPNEDSFIVGIAPTGTIMYILGLSNDGNWWQVDTSMGPGFVKAGQVALRGDASSVPRVGDPGPSFDGPTVRVNTNTPVVTEPGGGDMIGTLAAGTALPAGGRTADNTWWQVASTFGIGWIPVSNVSLAGAASNIRVTSNATFPGPGPTGAAFATVIIEAERKVAYNEATFASPPMWDIRLGAQGGVIGRSMDGLWLQITTPGYVGWINFSGVTLQGSMTDIPTVVVTPAPIVNIAIVNTHYLNIRSGPGVEYQAIGAASGGDSLRVNGKHPTLPWLRVTGSFGTGWVRIMYIIFRGTWSAVPNVTEPTGQIELPVAVTCIDRTVYSQPSAVSQQSTLPPGTYTIIGRTANYEWALLQTPLGAVWIPYNVIILRGIEAAIPVVD
ncbi:MAG: SH3 domain-containing protein [Anaerolineae bacterium]|nr:SH3 domain-containing protein [Anaerolineae bacterium]